MSKKVLVISTSLRPKSNSEALADEFIRGAIDTCHEVEKVSLRGKEIHFCKGCLVCQKLKICTIKDDMIPIIQQMYDADVIVFATPIYYYEMSGQMKTLIDRANALYGSDYHFRDIYMLMAASEDEPDVYERAIHSIGGWIACYPKSRLVGSVFAGGVNDMGEIVGHKALREAYEMGKSIK